MTPLEAAAAVSRPIWSIGSRFMFDPSTYVGAAEVGHEGLEFYFCGRGGVLGDVDASVVEAALGFFDGPTVRQLWESGRRHEAPAAAAARFADACAEWGRAHFGADLAYGELHELASAVVDAAPVAALPLFAGWRAVPRAADDRGAACQVLNVLREFRGGAHLLAVVAAGVVPLHAVLAKGGAANADLFGHRGPYPAVDHLTTALDEIEATTDHLVATAFAALDDAGLTRFVELVSGTRAGLV